MSLTSCQVCANIECEIGRTEHPYILGLVVERRWIESFYRWHPDFIANVQEHFDLDSTQNKVAPFGRSSMVSSPSGVLFTVLDERPCFRSLRQVSQSNMLLYGFELSEWF